LGKTDLAKAYIIPTLVAGILLMIIGVGLVYTNTQRITEFETAYQKDAAAFITAEFDRIESTLKEYNTIVFKAIPTIMIIASLLIILMDKPVWRASCITTIAMMIVILLIFFYWFSLPPGGQRRARNIHHWAKHRGGKSHGRYPTHF